jgi:hypothetical protein
MLVYASGAIGSWTVGMVKTRSSLIYSTLFEDVTLYNMAGSSNCDISMDATRANFPSDDMYLEF